MLREFLKRVRGSLTNFQITKLGNNPLEKFLVDKEKRTTNHSKHDDAQVKPNNYIAIDKASKMCPNVLGQINHHVLIAEGNKAC